MSKGRNRSCLEGGCSDSSRMYCPCGTSARRRQSASRCTPLWPPDVSTRMVVPSVADERPLRTSSTSTACSITGEHRLAKYDLRVRLSDRRRRVLCAHDGCARGSHPQNNVECGRAFSDGCCVRNDVDGCSLPASYEKRDGDHQQEGRTLHGSIVTLSPELSTPVCSGVNARRGPICRFTSRGRRRLAKAVPHRVEESLDVDRFPEYAGELVIGEAGRLAGDDDDRDM